MFTNLIFAFLLAVAPCPTEDSDYCAWDADARGNGGGASFYVIDGQHTWMAP